MTISNCAYCTLLLLSGMRNAKKISRVNTYADLKTCSNLRKSKCGSLKKVKKGLTPTRYSKNSLRTPSENLHLQKMSLEETHSEELEVDSLLNTATAFIRTCDLVWYDAVLEAKQKYQKPVFPSGVSYDGTVFSNSEIGPPFELIATFASRKSTNVSCGGFEGRQTSHASNLFLYSNFKFGNNRVGLGEAGRIRTSDHLLKRELLYH